VGRFTVGGGLFTVTVTVVLDIRVLVTGVYVRVVNVRSP
jgi:hypothetical protein